MTCHHAAALALVGWYMMVPPLSHTIRFEVDYRAPVSAWPIMRSFDNAEGCEDYRSHELEKYRASSRDGAHEHPANGFQCDIVFAMRSQRRSATQMLCYEASRSS